MAHSVAEVVKVRRILHIRELGHQLLRSPKGVQRRFSDRNILRAQVGNNSVRIELQVSQMRRSQEHQCEDGAHDDNRQSRGEQHGGGPRSHGTHWRGCTPNARGGQLILRLQERMIQLCEGKKFVGWG